MPKWDFCSVISCGVISHLRLFSNDIVWILNEELQNVNDNILCINSCIPISRSPTDLINSFCETDLGGRFIWHISHNIFKSISCNWWQFFCFSCILCQIFYTCMVIYINCISQLSRHPCDCILWCLLTLGQLLSATISTLKCFPAFIGTSLYLRYVLLSNGNG